MVSLTDSNNTNDAAARVKLHRHHRIRRVVEEEKYNKMMLLRSVRIIDFGRDYGTQFTVIIACGRWCMWCVVHHTHVDNQP